MHSEKERKKPSDRNLNEIPKLWTFAGGWEDNDGFSVPQYQRISRRIV